MTPKAIKADLNIFSGETPQLLFTAKDDQGSPVNITGAAVVFVIRDSDASGKLRVTKSGSKVTIHDQTAETGVFDVTLSKADTVGLVGTYYYEVGVILSGVELTTTYGAFQITKSGVR